MYAHCGGALPGVRGVVWCNRLHTHTHTAMIAASLRESELRIGGLRSFAPREKNILCRSAGEANAALRQSTACLKDAGCAGHEK